jgi:hypothetical protein
MAFARFTTPAVKAACEKAISLTNDEEHRERLRLIQALAIGAHGLSGEMFLTAQDFADLRSGWNR